MRVGRSAPQTRVDGRQPIDKRRQLRSAGMVALWTLVLCAVLVWPITRSGYLLGHDMVFTPRQPLDLASVGVSSSAPRAVPLDALVALAERLVDGAVVGRVAVVVPLLAAGIGSALLFPVSMPVARIAAATFAVWNPYLVERLALGQWALLWSYAALPYILIGLARLRGRWCLAVVAVALAAGSITPTGGVIVAVFAVGVAVGVRRRGRALATVVGLAVMVQLPWLVPSLVSTAAATSDPRAVAVFAARGEFGGGSLLSLLGGGGIWDADVVPVSRSGVLPWFGLVVLLGSIAVGVRPLVVLLGRRLLLTVGALACVGLVVAAAASVPGAEAVVRVLVDNIPGAGLLRDAQKWIMPLVFGETLLFGAAMQRLATAVRTRPWRAVLLVGAAAIPVLLLPDATAPVHATLSPVRYPADWSALERRLSGGGVATVLPFASYRTFPWAPGRASVLDPAPRLLPVPTVVDDRLAVSGTLLRGEDAQAAAVARVLRGAAAAKSGDDMDLAAGLARLGIRWVVVERATPGTTPPLTGLLARYDGPDVALYRVPGVVRTTHPASGRVAAVIVADMVAILAVLVTVGSAATTTLRGRRAPLI